MKVDFTVIETAFNNEIPEQLTVNLLSSYRKGLKEYSKGNWQYFINEIGQFNEVVYRILEYLLTGNYTSFRDKIPSFNETALVKWENISNKEISIRVIIPRMLYSMFCIRNKRGAIHKNDIDPNRMDATVLLANAKWILAELFRIFSKYSIIESQKIIDSLINKEVDLLWTVNDRIRILEQNLNCCEKILLILSACDSMKVDDLVQNIEYSNKSVFKSKLKSMHQDRLIEFDGTNCIISPKGMVLAEQIIANNN